MNVDELRKIIESPATSPEGRETAITNLQRMAQGAASGTECKAARKVLAELGQTQERPLSGLEAELLATAGVGQLADVSYGQIQSFCAQHRWAPEAWELYNRWIGSDVERLRVILELYLKLHFDARSTIKYVVSNSGKGWPNHWCNKDAAKTFLESGPGCEDAATVAREFIDTGRVTMLPETCECWGLTRAIERAHAANDYGILRDYLEA